ncbi:MAG: exopolysaccharide biosynthesis protein [Pseudomonadota bacterium]
MLDEVADSWRAARVDLGELIDRLGDRGHGVVLFVLAAPNLVPIPIPIASLLTGPPMAICAALLLLGRPKPWLPDALRRRSMALSDFTAMIARTRGPLRWVETVARPRMPALCTALADRAVGLVSALMALFVCVPLPLTNWFPAFAVALFSIGLVQQDGAVTRAGGAAAILATVFMLTLGLIGAAGVAALFALGTQAL